MKKAVLFSVFFLLTLTAAFAYQGNANFYARRGQLIQVVIDGRLVNPVAAEFVKVEGLSAGTHRVDFKIFMRSGTRFIFSNSIQIEPGIEYSYTIERVKRRGFLFDRIGMKPIPEYYQPAQPANPKPEPRSNTNPCGQVITESQFQQLKQTLESKPLDETRLTIARQMLQDNQLMANDVKEIMQLFMYEESKLDFAKAAYLSTCDVKNYYVVNEALEFDSSVKELNKHIEKINRR